MSGVSKNDSEPQNRRISNRRISKGGFALLSLFFKIDRSTQSLDSEALEGKLTTGRIHSFDIRYPLFDLPAMP
jgi:hypothetical protein